MGPNPYYLWKPGVTTADSLVLPYHNVSMLTSCLRSLHPAHDLGYPRVLLSGDSTTR